MHLFLINETIIAASGGHQAVPTWDCKFKNSPSVNQNINLFENLPLCLLTAWLIVFIPLEH